MTIVYIWPVGNAEHDDLARSFVQSYLEFTPGYPHETVVVCNGGPANDFILGLFDKIPCSFFEHDDSGWDIGAYIAVSKTIKTDIAVYFGGSTYFKKSGWMQRMVEAWIKHGPGMYGAIATHEVAPHLSTSGFWCWPEMMLMYPIKITSKRQRYDFEHGPNAFWKIVSLYGFPVKLVTWDGEYDWQDWRKPPNIFRRGDQSNCIAFWHHCKRFDVATQAEKAGISGLSDTLSDPVYTALRYGLPITEELENLSEKHFMGAHGFK